MTPGFVNQLGVAAMLLSTLTTENARAQFVAERRKLVPRIDSSLNRSPTRSLVTVLERYLATTSGESTKRCRLVPSNSTSDRRLVASFAVRGSGGEPITTLVAPVLCGRTNSKLPPVNLRTYAESRSAVVGAVWGAFVLDPQRESVLVSAYLPSGVTVLDATDLNADGVPEFLTTADEGKESRSRERYEIWQMASGKWIRCAEGEWRSQLRLVRNVFAFRTSADTFELVEETSARADTDANLDDDGSAEVQIDRRPFVTFRCKEAGQCLRGEDVSRERQHLD